MRRSLVWSFLAAAVVAVITGSVFAFQNGTKTKTPAAKTTGTNGAGNEADKKTVGLIGRMEKSVDGVAKTCVKAIGRVFFYEIGKSAKTERVPFSDDLAVFKKSRTALVKSLKSGDDKSQKKVELTREQIAEIAEHNQFSSIAEFLRIARKDGFDTHECDIIVAIRKSEITEEEAGDLKRVLNATVDPTSSPEYQKFTTGRTVGFTIRRIDDDETAPGTFTAEVVRHGVPIVVAWLVLGAVFFTIRMGFVNFRGFKHAIKVTAGKYDNPDDKGEVNHFQALTAALSATVGLGNIAGVAIAVMAGGPGATFWMIVAGLLGMSSKFTECTLGQKYRRVRPDGRIMGGAMYYLSHGLKDIKLAPLGKLLGVLFAVLCVFASFGGGNAFQVNQSLRAVEQSVPWLKDYHWLYGIVMAGMVGIVIIGGIRRIAATAEKIVPLMCGVYVLACLWILLVKATEIPEAMTTIVSEAFTPKAGYGAVLGVLVMGFKRAAFSNEAGVGSAAIAHSAAKTEYPVREGIVALLEPFIDTVVICTMTALVIVITGAYSNPDYAGFVANTNGAGLTSAAMAEEISWFPIVLSVAVILFAYSTMISWSYYGERCWAYLFGDRASMAYRILFLVFVVLGSVMSATNVLDLSDLAILGMAFPNILGVVLLSGLVKKDLDAYWKKLKDGDFDRPNENSET
ncbi:MAG: alanine/glycine:cation symporter family protein [Planctomycetaceae bacterium]